MKKFLFGNWKMYLDYKESVKLASVLAKKIKKSDNAVAVFPGSLSLVEVKKKLKDKISVGAQNCAWVPKGAYTGEISSYMFFDVGCEYVLIGHSERRHVFGETNEEIRKKLEASLDAGLIPVLCVGETQKDKEEGKTQYRLKEQLMEALAGLDASADKIIFAYEPVWAIGTDNPCLPADAEDIHGWIKKEVKNYLEGEAKVIYGGSVKAENVASFISRDTIDGVLVGIASTKIDSFLAIIKAVKNQ
ncbi:MAG: triose-phosphate isomerase [Candidatus Magasanikbacteria bacterium RIFOXYA1_FULL_40_8]|uniref:Triosephosphate isomerase n=1 Tax=Candidatus Magasanikbacteria bacterium RIFOXYA1_FULL_40_8 TaxID=1798694 RepID=A0A1F6NVJ2_9BACT|nr:MAG: triose-phosphate isomerase [Candidatus Magasanikbacteria bacterium RIFOXYA1_FULL_40_8]